MRETITEKMKKELLRLLKEDEEFRLAVIGALAEGLVTRKETNAILREIKKLREDFNKRMEEMREDFNKRFEAFDKRMEAFERRMEEMREDFNKRFEAFDIKLSALGARWGIMNERAVRSALRGLLEKHFNAKVTKWEVFDEKGLVYGVPSVIDVDILIRDKEHILIEIKSHVRKSDIAELLRISELYREKMGIVPKLIVVSPYIDENAREFAKMKQVELYTEKELIK